MRKSRDYSLLEARLGETRHALERERESESERERGKGRRKSKLSRWVATSRERE